MVENPNIAIIDCQTTGISGDKFLGALIDMGADVRKITDALSVISNNVNTISDIHLDINTSSFENIRASQIILRFNEQTSHRTGNELLTITNKCLDNLSLSEKAKLYSLSIINTLITAEAKIHNSNPNDVHLHEAGSVDTLVDSIGSAIALENLNLFKNIKWVTLPVAVGSGNIKFSHGIVSVPAPATLKIISENYIEIIGGPVAGELTTPTGAAILASLKAKSISHFPNIKIKSIGYGSGLKSFSGIPNIMRLIIGYEKAKYSNMDEIVILETNLDDISGEVLGYTIEKLVSEGNARDVCIIPTITKKNRPGHILKVITDKENENNILKLIMEETGTLGVRKFYCKRYVLVREYKTIEIEFNNKKWKIKIKLGKNNEGKIIKIKPEFDDIIKISQETTMPPRFILEIVNKKIQSIFF
ncbi:MAG: nickel pincer cofactor biosynthesis protein LarC [Candidatus Helarchaeota archaeon]